MVLWWDRTWKTDEIAEQALVQWLCGGGEEKG